MEPERIVKLANSVAEYFWDPRVEQEPQATQARDYERQRDEAARGIAEHLRKFWDPRMRRELVALVERLQSNTPDGVRGGGPVGPEDEPRESLLTIVVRAVELERERWFPRVG